MLPGLSVPGLESPAMSLAIDAASRSYSTQTDHATAPRNWKEWASSHTLLVVCLEPCSDKLLELWGPRNIGCVRAPLLHILTFGLCIEGHSGREGVGLWRRVRLGVEAHVLRVLRNPQCPPPLEKGKGQSRDRAGPGDHHENQDDLCTEG